MKTLKSILITRCDSFSRRQRVATIDFAISSTVLLILMASTATVLTVIAALNIIRATRRIKKAAPPITE